MPNDVITERATLVLEHARVIDSRIKRINRFEDFIDSDNGLMLYDSLIIRLQAIGENCKKIQQQYPTFFDTVIPQEIKNIIRFRDFISHHYELIDYQTIYQVCTEKVPIIIKEFEAYLASRDQ
jgi:uncharacterized protein with HEPN domain